MKRGGLGMDVTVFFICAVIFVGYGIYKHTKAEDTDYAKLIKQVGFLEGEIKDIEKSLELTDQQVLNAVDRMGKVEEKVSELSKDNEEAQEHMAKLRKSQIDLRDRSYPREIKLKTQIVGPIPIEVYQKPEIKHQAIKPDKKLIQKLKKDIKTLSK
jgi:septal ring factor EnvC (AmiA/AmiB activator)